MSATTADDVAEKIGEWLDAVHDVDADVTAWTETHAHPSDVHLYVQVQDVDRLTKGMLDGIRSNGGLEIAAITWTGEHRAVFSRRLEDE